MDPRPHGKDSGQCIKKHNSGRITNVLSLFFAILSVIISGVGLWFIVSTYWKYEAELDYSLAKAQITPLVTYATPLTLSNKNKLISAQISITPQITGKYIPRVWYLAVFFASGVTVNSYDNNWKKTTGVDVYTFQSEEPLVGVGGGSFIGDVKQDRAGWFNISIPEPETNNDRVLIGIFITAGDRVDGVTQEVYYDFGEQQFVYQDINLTVPKFNFTISTSTASTSSQ